MRFHSITSKWFVSFQGCHFPGLLVQGRDFMAVPNTIWGRRAKVIRLEPIPYPVYFVPPYRKRWADVFDASQVPDPDNVYWRFVDSKDTWIMRTYLHLRRAGLDVTYRLAIGSTGDQCHHELRSWHQTIFYHSYVVSCRADTFRPTICHHTIVQNPNNLLSPTDHLVQHWPQPGLIQRDVSRGSRLETIVYMGVNVNLWSAFRDPSFEHKLREIGVAFRINEDFHQVSRLR